MRMNIFAGSGRGVSLLAIAILLAVTITFGLGAAPVFAAPGIEYTIRPGDTLHAIALYYGSTPNAIVAANGLPSPDVIWIGQSLTIPVGDETDDDGGGAASQHFHVVQLGETLAQIALVNRTTVYALTNANDISDPDMLYVGQKLLIPGPPEDGALPDFPSGGTEIEYVVQSGDTLGQIAAQYGLTSAVVARANGLSSPNMLEIGMALRIPIDSELPEGATVQASRFVVSISQQKCWLYSGNTILYDWICSTGQWGAGTNTGTFAIQSKLDKAFGSTWNIWMPYWMGIYWAGATENGIHGIPYDVDTGWRLWDGYVGTPVTYGCVLLDDENAAILYDMAYIGMPVIIQP